MRRQNELIFDELSERFKLVTKLGEGGFGEVYEAYDVEREALVALKTLTEVSPSHLMRFKREFRSLAQLTHPNLVALYELHSHRELWFFTMELLRGKDFLSALLEKPAPTANFLERSSGSGDWEIGPDDSMEALLPTRRPVRRAHHTDELEQVSVGAHAHQIADMTRLRRAMFQLARGITALHGVRRLHRDIKPSNIIITPEERVVLLDFGLVCELDSVSEGGFSRMRTPAHFVGTPHYMAPEQALGREVTAASDWYSVGVLLYQALTGHRPIEGKTPLQILMRKQSVTPRHVLELNPAAPAELAELAMRLLERDPDERPRQEEILSSLRYESTAQATAVQRGGWSRQPSARLRAEPFVGRVQELEVLKWALRSLKSEKMGALVSLSAPSGLGKTALLKRFLRHANKHDDLSLLVLEGYAYDSESMPYKALDPIIDQLVTFLEALPPAQLESIRGLELGALVSLFPVLQALDARFNKTSAARVLAGPDAQAQRERAFDELRALFGVLAEQHTVIIALENAQWADEDSAALLEALLTGPNAPALMFLVSYRSEARESAAFIKRFERFMAHGHHDAQRYSIALEPLTDDDASKLAASLLDSTFYLNALSQIVKESKGNPFFIHEMARHFVANPSVRGRIGLSLEAVLFERVSQLPPNARRVLEVLCVAHMPLPEQLVRQVVSLQGVSQDALVVLRNAHCVQVRSARAGRLLEPYHDKLRDAVLTRMTPVQQRLIHDTLAQALSVWPGREPEVVAYHYIRADLAHKAVPYLEEAAQCAARALAFEKATQRYQELLEVSGHDAPQRGRWHELAGEYAGYVGRGLGAGGHYLEAAALEPAPEKARQLKLRAANQFLRVGEFERGMRLLDELLHDAGLARPKLRALMITKSLKLRATLSLTELQDPPNFKLKGRQPTALDRWRMELCRSASQGISGFDVRSGAYLGLLYLQQALQFNDREHLSQALSAEAVYLLGRQETAARGRALSQLSRSLLDAQDLASPHYRCQDDLFNGIGLYLRGDWASALARLDRGLTLSAGDERDGLVWESEGLRLYRFLALEQVGQFGPFYHELPSRLEQAQRRQDAYYTMAYEIWSCMGALAQDRADAALDVIARSAQRLGPEQHYSLHHYWLELMHINATLYRGDGLEAWRLCCSRWVSIKRSFVMQTMDVALIAALELRGRCALMALVQGAPQPEIWRDLEACIAQLDRFELGAAKAHAAALKAQRLKLLNDALWSAQWARARGYYARAGMGVWELSMRLADDLWRGRGDQASSQELWAALLGRGVMSPLRWCKFYVPLSFSEG